MQWEEKYDLNLIKLHGCFIYPAIILQSPDTHIFNMRYIVACKVYIEYHGTSETEHGLSACMCDNPLA